jgi:hypothetical protein
MSEEDENNSAGEENEEEEEDNEDEEGEENEDEEDEENENENDEEEDEDEEEDTKKKKGKKEKDKDTSSKKKFADNKLIQANEIKIDVGHGITEEQSITMENLVKPKSIFAVLEEINSEMDTLSTKINSSLSFMENKVVDKDEYDLQQVLNKASQLTKEIEKMEMNEKKTDNKCIQSDDEHLNVSHHNSERMHTHENDIIINNQRISPKEEHNTNWYQNYQNRMQSENKFPFDPNKNMYYYNSLNRNNGMNNFNQNFNNNNQYNNNNNFNNNNNSLRNNNPNNYNNNNNFNHNANNNSNNHFNNNFNDKINFNNNNNNNFNSNFHNNNNNFNNNYNNNDFRRFNNNTNNINNSRTGYQPSRIRKMDELYQGRPFGMNNNNNNNMNRNKMPVIYSQNHAMESNVNQFNVGSQNEVNNFNTNMNVNNNNKYTNEMNRNIPFQNQNEPINNNNSNRKFERNRPGSISQAMDILLDK